VKWLLREGKSSITEQSNGGYNALLCAIVYGRLSTAGWLLEHGGADITIRPRGGITVWELLEGQLIDEDENNENFDAAAVTALLRIVLLRGAPPTWLTALARAVPVDHAATRGPSPWTSSGPRGLASLSEGCDAADSLLCSTYLQQNREWSPATATIFGVICLYIGATLFN
jgi:hypothetical protein